MSAVELVQGARDDLISCFEAAHSRDGLADHFEELRTGRAWAQREHAEAGAAGLVGDRLGEAEYERLARGVHRHAGHRLIRPYWRGTADDLAAIDAAAAAAEITVQGDRYAEAMQRMIDR